MSHSRISVMLPHDSTQVMHLQQEERRNDTRFCSLHPLSRTISNCSFTDDSDFYHLIKELSAGLLSFNCMISGIIKASLDGGMQHKTLRWRADLLGTCTATWEKAAPRHRVAAHGEMVAGASVGKQNTGGLARLCGLPGEGVVWVIPQVQQRRGCPRALDI